MIVDLARSHSRQALDVRAVIVRRLRRGLGFDGMPLAPLKRPRKDGKPLGGSLPEVLERAAVISTQAGYEITFPDPVRAFDDSRKIVGVSAEDRQRQVHEDALTAAAQITLRLRRGA